jgi:addiction module HigA family antidote
MPKDLIISPAVVLKEKFMDLYQLKPVDLAKGINVNPAIISNVLNSRQRITIPIALRLAKYFKTTEAYWTDLQYKYDLSQITKDPALKAALKAIKVVQKPKPSKKAGPEKAAAKKTASRKPAAAAPKKPAVKRQRKAEPPVVSVE